MPVLKARETKKITLVTDPTAWVEIYVKQTYGDSMKIQKAMLGDGMDLGDGDKKSRPKIKGDISAYMMATLECMMVNWNFTDEAGIVLPITKENIALLDNEDGSKIFLEVNGEDATGLDQDEDAKNLEKSS